MPASGRGLHPAARLDMSRDFDPRDDLHSSARDRGREREFQDQNRDRSEPGSREDPREVFTRNLDLPRGRERERIHVRGHDYDLRGSESRTLATVGSFRVVPADRLRDHNNQPADARHGDLRHLRESGLVRTVKVEGRSDVVVLTDRGRNVLDASRRDVDVAPPQEFYSGLTKPRELAHDSTLYDAYLDAAERLSRDGAEISRVVLDYELKSEYQSFLQEHNRGRSDSDGRPDRTREEIEAWAEEHDLPTHDGHVQFPDVRIEYEDEFGREHVHDLEVETEHYRGGHAAAKGGAGFSTYRKASGSLGSGKSRGGSPFDPRAAERLVR